MPKRATARSSSRPLRPEAHPSRAPTLAFAIGVAGLLGYLTSVAFTAPNAVGVCEDDAVYLVTAKALAEGHGYRRIDLPGEPHQTKYPVLYPLVLSRIWRLCGDYPANLPWLRLPSVVAAGVAVVLGVAYAARFLPLGRTGRAVLAVLCLTLPELRFYSYFTMSELLFTAWLLAALWASELAAAASGRRALALAVLGASAGGLAFLTRTIGVTLIVALMAWYLVRRRPALAGLTALIAGLFVIGQWVWCHAAAAGDGPLRHAALLQYELNYGAWLPQRLADLPLIASQNFAQLAFAHFYFLVRLPLDWLARAFASGGAVLLMHLAVWVTLLVTVLGYVASAQCRLTAAHAFVPVYLAAVLVWPFEPIRFLAPLFVFVIAFAILGAAFVAYRVGRQRLVQRTPWPVAPVLAPLAGLSLTGMFIAHHPVLPGFSGSTCRVFLNSFDMAEFEHMADHIRQYAPPDAVLASNDHAAATFLATGRKTVGLFPVVKPVAYFYSPARRWRTFCLLPADDEAVRLGADVLDHLTSAYTEIGVRYQFVSTEAPQAENQGLAAHLQAFPERYRLVYVSPGRTVVGREWLAP